MTLCETKYFQMCTLCGNQFCPKKYSFPRNTLSWTLFGKKITCKEPFWLNTIYRTHSFQHDSKKYHSAVFARSQKFQVISQFFNILSCLIFQLPIYTQRPIVLKTIKFSGCFAKKNKKSINGWWPGGNCHKKTAFSASICTIFLS